MSESMNADLVRGREKPSEFRMRIQGGMLEALGINMYTTLGKCLVEFIANAYDGDAANVSIALPVDRIAEARRTARAAAKARIAKAGGPAADRFRLLLEPLPPDIAVRIEDDGHGMTWKEVEEKFLPLNRKRRDDGNGGETANLSESGKRFVMGRKGLGKLAGFGAAEKVVIRTKRKSETFATIVTLDDRILKTALDISETMVPATYEEDLDADEHGTSITLFGLKADAVKEGEATIGGVILEAFNAVRADEMAIRLNGMLLEPKPRDYEFVYPETRDGRGYASEDVTIEDVGSIPISFFVGFTKRGDSLPARQRGARIYCNNRLAAGPSLFKLPSGMHSFHSTDYMECIVEADALDRAGVDLINTNRTQLREDNDAVRCVIDKVTDIMKEAVKAHARFREGVAEQQLEDDPDGKVVRAIVKQLPTRTREPATKLLRAISVTYGVGTPEFKELAPALVNSVNATEVLMRLIHLRTEPETIARVASHLQELAEIERTDALKLYRGRRDGIMALKILIERGEKDEWNKVGREKDLHSLLKDAPWLIRPEFSTYLSSDRDLNVVASKLAEQLRVDDFARMKDGEADDETRPDLVFLMADAMAGPHVVNIVELKSPTLALKMEHLDQLKTYIFQVEQWCRNNVAHAVSVRGFLIGAMPKANATAVSQLRLREEYQKQGANPGVRILGLQELVQEAWNVHIEAIRAMERAEAEEDRSTDPEPSFDDLIEIVPPSPATVEQP